MAEPIIFTRVPIVATQQDILRTALASSGFSILKEVISAKCIEAQVKSMNAHLYMVNESAIREANEQSRMASKYNSFLDILDELQEKEEEWFTAKLEHRR